MDVNNRPWRHYLSSFIEFGSLLLEILLFQKLATNPSIAMFSGLKFTCGYFMRVKAKFILKLLVWNSSLNVPIKNPDTLDFAELAKF